MITTPVPTVALLAAARAMTEPEPPADLGLYRAVRESQFPWQPFPRQPFPRQPFPAVPPAPGASESEPPPSSRRPSPQQASGEERLRQSEPFEFELTPRSMRNSQAAPPLAEELGLDHLLADFKPQRSWSEWLRTYGVWVVAALLVLWLIVQFAARWLPA